MSLYKTESGLAEISRSQGEEITQLFRVFDRVILNPNGTICGKVTLNTYVGPIDASYVPRDNTFLLYPHDHYNATIYNGDPPAEIDRYIEQQDILAIKVWALEQMLVRLKLELEELDCIPF